jgi:hypothetical protein
MNAFCVPITLKLDPLTKSASAYGIEPHTRIPLEEVSSHFVDFLAQRNLKIFLVEMFYNPPFKVSRIHIDALGGDYSKINFVYGGEKSLMCWYQTDVVKNQIDYTNINTRSVDYRADEVVLAHRRTVRSPSIVQVGVPHNIINAARARWCVSVVPVSADTQKRLSFQDTVSLFKDLT